YTPQQPPQAPPPRSRVSNAEREPKRPRVGSIFPFKTAIVIGILVGAFAGYYGGWVGNVLMRITEAFQTLPNFVLLLVLVAVFGSTLTTVTIAVGVVSWPAPARLT
ncbi:ABC transporter permease subunit, partial [Escherichia coli]|uniref:ABC transporter permease subunit n=1 Tax=Escherichia coli TaxID=562 RepID=UPI001915A3E5